MRKRKKSGGLRSSYMADSICFAVHYGPLDRSVWLALRGRRKWCGADISEPEVRGLVMVLTSWLGGLDAK